MKKMTLYCPICDVDFDTENDDIIGCPDCGEPCDCEYDSAAETFAESMDGDFDTAMASAGFGTDEDYGLFGGEDW